MNNLLTSRLKEFKLAGMLANLEQRLTYAQSNKLGYTEFLEILCEDECNNRNTNSYKKRYAKSKLIGNKDLKSFDFKFQPSIDQKIISDAMTCDYIEKNKNIIFIGQPGTGKTHLSVALGLQALNKNYKVLFTSVHEMLYQLHISNADNSYNKKLSEYLAPDLLILDELGFKKLPNHSADDLFEVISRRYERGSCIITTNKSFEQWGEILGDTVMANAITDRVIHHSVIIKINGQSYRAKEVADELKN
tara:strand:+ start:923 stop:1666 length:744 start_codon:yes stop_codon:yes gene_type:complete